MADLERGKTRVKGFVDEEMDFQLIRQLGSCTHGGASIGECLSMAARIADGSPASWVREYSDLAERQERDAAERLARGHRISARDQFLKAGNSYRAAEYYTASDDPLHRKLGTRARECFHEAMKHVWHTFESVMIPYKDIQMPLYFMTPNERTEKRKTLLIVSGYDGTTEEEYLSRGYSALERGYNVLLFAGPGQMDTLRFHPDTHFEPDFENPVREIIDFCTRRPEIDMGRLALAGISFGGYFAGRAASYEPRIRALILNSPIMDLHAYMTAFIGFDPAEIPDENNFCLEDLPLIPENVMSKQQKVMAANMMRRFGRPSFKETYGYLREFNFGKVAANIKCPCFAMVGEGEGREPGLQFRLFCEKVSGPVAFHTFTEAEGADTHCQVGNVSYSAAVCLDWLDEVLA